MAAIQTPGALASGPGLDLPVGTEPSIDGATEVMRFAGDGTVPIWLAFTYLGANVTLNALNFYWFGKMIETVRKRFQPEVKEANAAGEKVETDSGVFAAAAVVSSSIEVESDRKLNGSIAPVMKVEQTEMRRRKE